MLWEGNTSTCTITSSFERWGEAPSGFCFQFALRTQTKRRSGEDVMELFELPSCFISEMCFRAVCFQSGL